eukprot:364399-Chlamydomonas_euryale.AAC.1
MRSATRLCQSLLDPLLQPGAGGGSKAASAPAADAAVLVECSLLFALVWTIGGAVDGPGRAIFDKALRGVLQVGWGRRSARMRCAADGWGEAVGAHA